MYQAFRKVSTGFKLVYAGLVIVVLAVVIGFLGGVVLGAAMAGGAAGGGAAAGRAAFGGAVVLLMAVGVIAIVGSVVGLVGRFHCMAIPDEAGSAKPMIVTSVVLELISLSVSVVNTADNAGANFLPAQVKMVTGGLTMIFSIVAAILFLLFTKSVAEFIRRPRLAEDAMSVLWLWVSAAGCYAVGLAITLLMVAAGGGGVAAGGCIGSIFMLTALVIGLVALVRYARLLTEMSAATLRYAERVGDDEDDYDDRPRRKRRRRVEEDEDEVEEEEEEEEEEERPRRRAKPKPQFEVVEDDDEDEDDRPRRRRRE